MEWAGQITRRHVSRLCHVGALVWGDIAHNPCIAIGAWIGGETITAPSETADRQARQTDDAESESGSFLGDRYPVGRLQSIDPPLACLFLPLHQDLRGRRLKVSSSRLTLKVVTMVLRGTSFYRLGPAGCSSLTRRAIFCTPTGRVVCRLRLFRCAPLPVPRFTSCHPNRVSGLMRKGGRHVLSL